MIKATIFRSSFKNTSNFETRTNLSPSPFIKKWSLSHDPLVKTFIKQFRSIIQLLLYLVNSVLAVLCQYDNQTFSINQSIVTSNCTERCQCHHINGTAIAKCKRLCPIEVDPECHPHTERIEEFERPLNDSNCTCTEKRCVSGIKTLRCYF